jgi:L-lactate dehydrogenase complex protein LldG
MSSARDAILRRLRAARATARLPRPDPTTAPRLVLASAEAKDGTAGCLRRFVAEAAGVGVECWVEETSDGVRSRVRSLVSGSKVLSWNLDELPYGVGAVLGEPVLGGAALEQQASAEIGVTGCDAAIAETASLVMLSRHGRSRTVSLLPPVHVAVVSPATLCCTMGDFFTRYRQQLAESASCTFITGPSRTADIELTLTLGIHGPGRVVVVFGPDEPH